MLEAVLVVYSVCVARSDKENHINIFGGLYHIYIHIYDNITWKTTLQYMVNPITIHCGDIFSCCLLLKDMNSVFNSLS